MKQKSEVITKETKNNVKNFNNGCFFMDIRILAYLSFRKRTKSSFTLMGELYNDN